MRDSFLKKLFSKVDCGVCGQRYDVSNIKILDHEDGVWFLSVFCSSCGTQGLIAAVVREGNITEVITDLTESEYKHFEKKETVAMADVLDMCEFLKDFGGDFSGLFSGE